MTVTIAGIEFDDVAYDRGADVLYLSAGKPRAASDLGASPEGHYLRYDEKGAPIGITIVNARRIFEGEGSIPITLPEQQVEVTDLGAVLAAT